VVDLQCPRDGQRAPADDAGRVLVVEDEAVVSLLLSDALTRRGHEVVVHHDGSDAVDAFVARAYDVAFIDLGWPGLSGDEIARQLQARDPELATILISGWDLEHDDGRLEPFDFYLRKPFDVKGTEAMLTQALGRRAGRALS
jgi:DNA-binding response OmpR family regulator